MENEKFVCPACNAPLTPSEVSLKECWDCGSQDIKPQQIRDTFNPKPKFNSDKLRKNTAR